MYEIDVRVGRGEMKMCERGRTFRREECLNEESGLEDVREGWKWEIHMREV